MGRHSLLTSERSAAILDMVRGGVLIKTACAANGITYETLRTWLRRAEDPNDDPKYSAFADAFTRARALAEADAVQMVVTAGHKDWRAAAWFLERSFPKDYGRLHNLEHTGADGGTITLAGLEALMGVESEAVA
jgi:hypothetical protein